VVNDSPRDLDNSFLASSSLTDVHLVDLVNRRQYGVCMKDVANTLSSSFAGVETNSLAEVWAVYGAPPPAVTKFTIMLPNFYRSTLFRSGTEQMFRAMPGMAFSVLVLSFLISGNAAAQTAAVQFPSANLEFPSAGVSFPFAVLSIPARIDARETTETEEVRIELAADVLFDFDKADIRSDVAAATITPPVLPKAAKKLNGSDTDAATAHSRRRFKRRGDMRRPPE
jgi:hypothetical protein